MPSLDKFQQTPSEVKKYVFDYTCALDDDETISTLAYATETVPAPGCVTPAAITAGSGQVESGGKIAFFLVSGGSDGANYKVSLLVTTSAGQTLENTISVQIKSP
jgi:hypothetical protein